MAQLANKIRLEQEALRIAENNLRLAKRDTKRQAAEGTLRPRETPKQSSTTSAPTATAIAANTGDESAFMDTDDSSSSNSNTDADSSSSASASTTTVYRRTEPKLTTQSIGDKVSGAVTEKLKTPFGLLGAAAAAATGVAMAASTSAEDLVAFAFGPLTVLTGAGGGLLARYWRTKEDKEEEKLKAEKIRKRLDEDDDGGFEAAGQDGTTKGQQKGAVKANESTSKAADQKPQKSEMPESLSKAADKLSDKMISSFARRRLESDDDSDDATADGMAVSADRSVLPSMSPAQRARIPVLTDQMYDKMSVDDERQAERIAKESEKKDVKDTKDATAKDEEEEDDSPFAPSVSTYILNLCAFFIRNYSLTDSSLC
jgi:hypothetical protein